ncbi:electron transfer flavoprotein subunit alpha/FixB family protein [Haloferax sp. DFSO60]|uniref:electron transfer flavoprotein subunit alpha/FixB family protein n=1 Tax=Haloferax sp. DFSO60 TaxID=3388652 RepID=UPI003979EE9A
MSVLAVVEHRRGALRDVSFELVTAGAELAEQAGEELHLAIIGGDVDAFAEELSLSGVDAIHTVAEGDEFNHDVYVQAVTALAEELDPTFVLMGNTVNGLDYAPAVADVLELPLVTDAIELGYEDGLVATREMYASKVQSTIEVDADRAAVTIRPGEWDDTEDAGEPGIEAFDFDLDESRVRSTVTGFEEVGSGDVDITDADILVSVGRGIEEEENLELVQDLADALGATLSSSRPIVDNGWLPKDRQVGQSGKVVTPKVYLAIGISGAVQHVAGMKGAETIIAVNTDPDAPIFDIADYGVVGDLFDVVPELIEQFS